jgi:hypothetical protein
MIDYLENRLERETGDKTIGQNKKPGGSVVD